MTFEEADEAYPYDPAVRSDWLVGLEKLRAFDDPKMRRNVFDLWENTQRRGATRPARPDPRMTPRRECLDTEPLDFDRGRE